MKNFNKITKYFITMFWIGLNCTILKAEVVITELFILTADSIPQYLEFYNNSDSIVSLENWSIKILDGNGEQIFVSPINNDETYNTQTNNLEIDPYDYFIISSEFCKSTIGFLELGCNNGFFHNNLISDIIAKYLYLPLDGKASIILIDNNQFVIDSVGYNIDENWPVDEDSRGHSLRLHSPELDNSLNENWSLSPNTENSLWLYEENSEIKNFGSPREENSFRLNDILYFDNDATMIFISPGDTYQVSGDVNNNYNIFNNNQFNNFDVPLIFSWVGTFNNISNQSYRFIITKNNIPIINSSWESINDLTISVTPAELLIDSLGIDKEIADYTWTVELTNGDDIIYSDLYTFTIDASRYAIYGCIDDGCCTNDLSLIENDGCPKICHPNINDELYLSNHPSGCTPGINCFKAINYDQDALINTNMCNYVSLSIPAFIVGDTNTIATVPIYFNNDSLAEINEIKFSLNFDNTSGIVSYENGTFSGTGISQLDDENIVDAQNGNVSVNIPISSAESSFFGSGIITYLDFDLIGEQGESMDLLLTEAIVKGGSPINDISMPVKGGEIVILQTDYKISGQVYYYASSTDEEPFEIPNVALSLSQKYNGDIVPNTLVDYTNVSGSFIFDSLTEGNYNLSFSKDSANDCNGNYISGTDVYRITRHVMGSESFNADQLIAADVSLDGTVSGYDASLVAQYNVDLIDNFNDIKTHWIFKPFNQETLSDVYAELLEQNGIFSIEYKPLVMDDKHRFISAYLLGDVNSNYCHDQLSRYNDEQIQFINIAIDYRPVITLPIIISEPTFIKGMDIEIGYDEDIFNPHSITINKSNLKTKKYNSVSNLLSKDGSIKMVTWALGEPQLIEGIIGEVNFEWSNNKSGKIWLKEFQVNDEPAVGGISLISLSDNDVSDGVNIMNSLVPDILSLHQNYPNPFNPQTTITWSMPLSGIASLEVYNLEGRLVELLFNGQLEAGIHEQIWDATAYPSGIYFYRLISSESTFQRIMLLLK